jgi:hypothetical protein
MIMSTICSNLLHMVETSQHTLLGVLGCNMQSLLFRPTSDGIGICKHAQRTIVPESCGLTISDNAIHPPGQKLFYDIQSVDLCRA